MYCRLACVVAWAMLQQQQQSLYFVKSACHVLQQHFTSTIGYTISTTSTIWMRVVLRLGDTAGRVGRTANTADIRICFIRNFVTKQSRGQHRMLLAYWYPSDNPTAVTF